jgi:membrane protein
MADVKRVPGSDDRSYEPKDTSSIPVASPPGAAGTTATTPRRSRATAPGEPSKGVLRRTISEFNADNLTDWAAALTYYGVLSVFPGLLAMVSVLGLLGQSATGPLIDGLSSVAPGAVGDILTDSLNSLSDSPGSASVLVIVGVLGAIWTASGYVGAFMRAANAVYDIPEGRPMWKTLPIRLATTIAIGVLLALSGMIVIFTGKLAELAGNAIGLGGTAVTVWGIAKWPVLLLLVALTFALLYWASPNARLHGFAKVIPGGLLAVVLWIVASVGFAVYVANFASYNKTYGTLGGIIVFFVWLWISNLALLFGAEFNAELQRGRAVAAGKPETAEPFVELRDDRAVPPQGPSWADKDHKPDA